MKAPRIIVATALIIGLLPASAFAWCRLTTDQDAIVGPNGCTETGYPLAWIRRCITYSLYVGGSRDLTVPAMRPLIAHSFAQWSNVKCDGVPVDFDIRETEEESLCNRAVYNQEGGNVNAIMFVSDWASRDHDPAAFALTSVWHNSKGVIRDADMEINDTRRHGECPDMGSCAVVDVENVVTHEAGHFFGLAHSKDKDATMFASADVGETKKRDLAADDKAGFCETYPPGSLPGTCDAPGNFAPYGGFEATCHAEGGCAVRTPGGANGGLSMLVMAAVASLLLLRRRRTGST